MTRGSHFSGYGSSSGNGRKMAGFEELKVCRVFLGGRGGSFPIGKGFGSVPLFEFIFKLETHADRSDGSDHIRGEVVQENLHWRQG
jgi:hypothetical protein